MRAPSTARAMLQVSICVARLDDPTLDPERCKAWLSPEEVARAARYRFVRDARRFVIARAMLRSILGARLGVPPATLVLSIAPGGKPELRDPRCGMPAFNVSHSADVALCAIADHGSIGVDVEQVRTLPDLEDLMRLVLAPSERAQVLARTGAEREREFFRAWTLKEAWCKARGQGLTDGLARVAILPDRDGRLRAIPAVREWSFATFTPADGYLGAVAVVGDVEPRVCCRDWDLEGGMTWAS